MKKVAITGGIGSGKSTALRILKDMGYPVYSCDEIYKEILTRADYVVEVGRIFPNTVENGKINKRSWNYSSFFVNFLQYCSVTSSI